MSDSERWFAVPHGYNWIVETEGKPEDENFIADCGADDEAEGLAKGIASDHNGNLGIESPATTVPELVEGLKALAYYLNSTPDSGPVCWCPSDGHNEHTATCNKVRAVLAKTGKT